MICVFWREDHHLGCCLFGFTSGDTLNSYSLEHFPNHIRTDVTLNKDCFIELTLEIAALLTGAIYNKRLDALHTLHNCDTLPSKDIHIKALTSSKSTKSKAPCHNFGRGSCKFGDTRTVKAGIDEGRQNRTHRRAPKHTTHTTHIQLPSIFQLSTHFYFYILQQVTNAEESAEQNANYCVLLLLSLIPQQASACETCNHGEA